MSTRYSIFLSEKTISRISVFHDELLHSEQEPGHYLAQVLEDVRLADLSDFELIYRLLATKRPRVFAESEVRGDGSDWTLAELRLLGDLSVGVQITVFDNGLHHNPDVHPKPFPGNLIFTPGALLRNDLGLEPADWQEVTHGGEINREGYFQLYERRLLPGLRYASDQVGTRGSQALVTIPGIGCGQFAGPFREVLKEIFKETLLQILEKHHQQLPNLKAVYFDPYTGLQNERHQIGGIHFLVRPLTAGNRDQPQLCQPEDYQDQGDDFRSCDLFSFVAWDHVSWPGNDYYAGLRATDDGVKAAATDSMWKITGVQGEYVSERSMYCPPEPFRTWGEVVEGQSFGRAGEIKVY